MAVQTQALPGADQRKRRLPEWFPFNSPSTLMLVIIREDCSQSLVLSVASPDRSKYHEYECVYRHSLYAEATSSAMLCTLRTLRTLFATLSGKVMF